MTPGSPTRRSALLLFVAAFGLLVAAPFVSACGDQVAGSQVGPDAPENGRTFALASSAQKADFTVIRYDPTPSRGGDEVYYLRFAVTSGPNQLQVGDLSLATGRVLVPGDPDLGHPNIHVDDDFKMRFDVVGFRDSAETAWYLDVDSSGTLSRLDLRLTPVALDGFAAAAGTIALLSDRDVASWSQAAPDFKVTGITNARLAWFDTDANHRLSNGDCLLFQPARFSSTAKVGDVRLMGSLPAPPLPAASLNATVWGGDGPPRVQFDLAGGAADGAPFAWTLDVDGDGEPEYAGDRLPATVNHTYAGGGEFLARLTVDDGRATNSHEVLVLIEAPVVVEHAGNGTVTGAPTGDPPAIPGFPAVLLLAALGLVVLRRR